MIRDFTFPPWTKKINMRNPKPIDRRQNASRDGETPRSANSLAVGISDQIAVTPII